MAFLQLLMISQLFFSGVTEDPWADRVVTSVAFNPNAGFDTPLLTLGEPVGGVTSAPNNSSLASIGTVGSYLVLGFNTPVTDDPLNPFGLDCIVYSNAFWIGGNPQNKFGEPALIEISEDTNTNGLADDAWYVIPGSRNFSQSIVPGGIAAPSPAIAGVNPNSTDANPANNLDEYTWGYAELTPTQKKYLDNYVRPDDPEQVGLTLRSGGGDAFDIAWAVDGAGLPAGISMFHFIRIWSFINDTSTPEIEAVADVAPAVDMDNDDIFDEYETRVVNTDPTRPENTVLALEIPNEDGGSPLGTLLGMASDSLGNSILLLSSGTRTGTRDYNNIVDIIPGTNFGDPVPLLQKSNVFLEFQSSVSDFQSAQVQDALITIAYVDADVFWLYESTLQPWRHDGFGYTQDGISAIQVDQSNNTVEFSSRYSGNFVLAGLPQATTEGMPLHPTSSAILALCILSLLPYLANRKRGLG